jgi:hypothetical protein
MSSERAGFHFFVAVLPVAAFIGGLAIEGARTLQGEPLMLDSVFNSASSGYLGGVYESAVLALAAGAFGYDLDIVSDILIRYFDQSGDCRAKNYLGIA